MKGCFHYLKVLALAAGISLGGLFVGPLDSAYAQSALFASLEERDAYDLVSQENYIKARTSVENVLLENPDSIIGNYVLGRVYHMGEGDLHRAQASYKKAIKLFEEKYFEGDVATDNAELRAWHMQFLSEQAIIYAELDQREEELAVYSRIEKLYNRPMGVRASWALMKLGRYEEASKIDQAAISGSDRFARNVAYNDLTAIEDAQHHYYKAFEAGLKAVEFSHGKDCVILTNQARNEMYFMHSDSAISYVLKAEKTGGDSCPEPPLLSAVDPYLLRLEIQKAISAMKKVRKTHISKRMRVQAEMSIRTGLSELLMVLGFPDRARELMKTLIEAPGRLGYNSLSFEQVMLAERLFYYATIREDIRRIQIELDIYKGENSLWMFDSEQRKQVLDRVKTLDELKRTSWSITQQALKAMLNPENVSALLVPYYVFVSPAYYDVFVDVAGRGMTNALIDYEQSFVTEQEKEMFLPVWNYVRGYVAWRAKDYQKALELLDLADQKLSSQQKQIKVICSAIRGAILDEMGEHAKAYEAWVEPLMDYPVIFRQYNIKLPVKIDSELSGELREKAVRIAETDAFVIRENAPYVLSASRDEWLQFCLTEVSGRRVACSSAIASEYSSETDGSVSDWEIMSNFVTAVFSPRIDLTQMDIHSLDGSAVRVSGRQALEELAF